MRVGKGRAVRVWAEVEQSDESDCTLQLLPLRTLVKNAVSQRMGLVIDEASWL